MGSKNKGTVQETAAERAAADVAMARYQDYRQRWAPIQQRAAQVIQDFGAADSYERERAESRTAGAVGVAYDQAAEQVAAADRNRGIKAGSGAFRMRQADIGTERAKASGIARAAAGDAIDQAYIEGLSSMMAVGKGQADMAMGGMNRSASIEGANAATTAGINAANRAGNMELAGTVAGMAGGYMMNRPSGGGTQPWSLATDNRPRQSDSFYRSVYGIGEG